MNTSADSDSDTLGAVPQIIAVLVFIWFIRRRLFQNNNGNGTGLHAPQLRSVAILVLGDVGRSPRMMYHAESFAENGFNTVLVGYQGSTLIPSLRTLPNFQCIYLSSPPRVLSSIPFILAAPIKIIHQILTILAALLVHIPHSPEFILVQNPPSIPTLALVWLAGWIRGSKVIIDWHNLGYSILALRLGPHHPLVRLAEWFESYFGRTAYAHLFVTQAMQDRLVADWGLVGHKAVLHDRPPAHFHRCTPEELHELFLRLEPSLPLSTLASFLPSYDAPYSTPFTTTSSPSPPSAPTRNPFSFPSPSPSPSPPPRIPTSPTRQPHYKSIKMPQFRTDRPALLLSSTSWTPDEDFGILLDALGMYEQRARALSLAPSLSSAATSHSRHMKPATLPKLLAIVTGRGDGKAKYMLEVERRREEEEWEWVRCISVWLEAEDYPLLLGSADLGVSLHASSSALDLPMKVVDMFGCGLPVCALDFACLGELVKDGVNGLVFKDAAQLARQLETLLTSFPTAPALDSLRASLLHSSSSSSFSSSSPASSLSSYEEHTGRENEGWTWTSWAENWNKVVRPLVLSDVAVDGYRDRAEWVR